MLIPIKHENMTARRWPVVTLSLIAINVVVFLFTMSAIDNETPQLGEVKDAHPDSRCATSGIEDARRIAATGRRIQAEPSRPVEAGPESVSRHHRRLRRQDQNDRGYFEAAGGDGFARTSSTSSSRRLPAEQYAFVPAHPAISYLTANFLHGGWMHMIGNMWFLWLAGFVLEDVWGRWLYSAFYLIAGVAALQFYAWSNPGSITPTLGASGAVAALMGAFLVRFPKMKIEMGWLFLFQMYRFKAAAYWLLPLWLFREIFYGSLFGSSGGVAHWAHVGGFLFGALAALAIQHSGHRAKDE